MKRKHSWHCGICEGDLVALRKGKGTKYLFCPKCDKIVAYHNKGILGKIAKGALRSLPGGDIVAELLPDGKPQPLPSPASHSRRMSEVEKVERIERILKR